MALLESVVLTFVVG